MIAAVAALVMGASPACVPLKDSASLWASPATRWILFGEAHGTNEMPEAFTNLVCLAAEKRGPITVVIEWPAETQPLLDAWLKSDGGKRAKDKLLSAPAWRYKDQGGFTSTAFLKMFERMRLLYKAGKVSSIEAFDKAADGSDGRDRNVVMAERLKEIAVKKKDLVMVMVGNVHASRIVMPMGPNEVVKPAAYLLPESQRITIGVTSPGGSAWSCRREGCHVYDDGAGPSHAPSITWHKEPDRRFDVTYDLGSPVTASLPEIPPQQEK